MEVGHAGERTAPGAAVLADLLDRLDDQRDVGQALLDRRQLAVLDHLGQLRRLLELGRRGRGRFRGAAAWLGAVVAAAAGGAAAVVGLGAAAGAAVGWTGGAEGEQAARRPPPAANPSSLTNVRRVDPDTTTLPECPRS